MSPEVTAAVIAVGGVILTVIATVAVQISGRRATSRDTQKTLAEQREQLNATLTEQRKQLDRTLAEQRTRTLNERFATAAGQLGDDKPPAVRLAGVYAMAGLADDWPENRQTCVDVLCAYLRLPYDPAPGGDADPAERAAYRANREVRHTVIRVITAHLRDDAAVSWQGLDLDFTGTVFDGGDFSRANFSGGAVCFDFAKFSRGTVRFDWAKFCGGLVTFIGAEFSGGLVIFAFAKFSGRPGRLLRCQVLRRRRRLQRRRGLVIPARISLDRHTGRRCDAPQEGLRAPNPASMASSGTLRRPVPGRHPSACSAKVTAGHCGFRQRNRRTRKTISTGRPPAAPSATVRAYPPCTRADSRPHLGQQAEPA